MVKRHLKASKKLKAAKKRRQGGVPEGYEQLSVKIPIRTPVPIDQDLADYESVHDDDHSDSPSETSPSTSACSDPGLSKGQGLRWQAQSFTKAQASETFEQVQKRGDFTLNVAVLAALQRQKFIVPTPVQRGALPLALSGKDCLFKAPTGTGKTLAFALPVLSMVCDAAEAGREHSSLPSFSHSSGEASSFDPLAWRNQIKAVILVPSKELVFQVAEVIESLTFHVSDLVAVWSMPQSPTAHIKSVRPVNPSVANVLVTQPAALVKLCRAMLPIFKKSTDHLVFLPGVRHLVLDEADLVMTTFGFHKETSDLFAPNPADWQGRSVSVIPSGQSVGAKAQIILASASLSEEVAQLHRMALYKPAVLCVSAAGEGLTREEKALAADEVSSLVNLVISEDAVAQRSPIKHFYYDVDRTRRHDFLALFCLLKFEWCRKKTIVFTADIDSAYKVYLFLQHFGFKVCVVSPTQSLATRLSNFSKFNQSIFSVLVACDGVFAAGGDPIVSEGPSVAQPSMDGDVVTLTPITESKKLSKKAAIQKAKMGDKLSSMSRGMDFKGVESIVHFMCPADLTAYQHRCGRAVRDFKRSGVVGTSVVLTAHPTELQRIQTATEGVTEVPEFTEILQEDTALFKAYQYRVSDVCQRLTKTAICQCQIREAAIELETAKDASRNLSSSDKALLDLTRRQVEPKTAAAAASGNRLHKTPKYLGAHQAQHRNPLLID